MRTVEVSLGGTVYQMPVNFAASLKVDELAGDPFELALGLSRGKMLTFTQMVGVITAGVRAAGCQLEPDKIGEAIIEAGAQNFLKAASKYVIDIASGSPEIAVNSKKKRARAAG